MKYIIANWKSNKSLETVQHWLSEFENHYTQHTDHTIIICPAFPHLPVVAEWLQKKNFSECALGMQDISSFPAGSYTGAISGLNVQGLLVEYVLVGHSERRRFFHETQQDVANKVTQALDNNMTPVLCLDDEYILEQAAALAKEQLKQCFVAYEDLAAIGTGNSTGVAQVTQTFQTIKTAFGEVPVLYGGSVDDENADKYLSISDGVLVGSASLDAKEFLQLIDR